MAKKKPTALQALAIVNDERVALEARAAELKRAAALELGMVVLDAGGADLDPKRLRDLVARALATGPDAALRMLSGKGESVAASTLAKLKLPASSEAGNG